TLYMKVGRTCFVTLPSPARTMPELPPARAHTRYRLLNSQTRFSLLTLLQTLAISWEIIVVDDGSSDQTPSLMAQWTRQPGFAYVQLSRNFGKEAALTAGLEAAQGDVIVLLDADLQHPTSLIPAML
uniref:Glycosyltransferase 2-like domain-containing protein n=1 Tax=Hucho hucho TaxID=62062 RepID=A0A4W5LMV2_9TELE